MPPARQPAPIAEEAGLTTLAAALVHLACEYWLSHQRTNEEGAAASRAAAPQEEERVPTTPRHLG